MKTITIMLSTYNGGQYLEKQLETICGQAGLEDYSVRLLIRDDGSRDNTVSIIDSWKDRLNITLIRGENIGARNSFFYLLNRAPISDYYAFCDQDDVWYADKLKRAIDSIQRERTLYFSNIEYIDSNGTRLGKCLLAPDFQLGLKRILMCNPANGCTMVWDHALHEAVKGVPQDTFTMHDEYLCTVAFLFGHVVYDPLPSMGYRLHSANVTQSNSLRKKLKLWKSIWFDRKDYALDKRAAMLLTFEVAEEYRKDLEDLRDYKRGLKRWRLAGSYRCENYRIERSFKTRMLLGIV